MSGSVDRRTFLEVASSGLALGVAGASRVLGANESIAVGGIGEGGRGTGLARTLAQQAQVEGTDVWDPATRRAGTAAEALNKVSGRSPKPVGDFRRILDDKSVDVVVVATCNHWHAPAAILGCTAGKHVYVEKPCSHNPREGELMVQAASKHDRSGQMG